MNIVAKNCELVKYKLRVIWPCNLVLITRHFYILYIITIKALFIITQNDVKLYAETKLNEESVYRMNVFVIIFVCLFVFCSSLSLLWINYLLRWNLSRISMCVVLFLFFFISLKSFLPVFTWTQSHPVAQITYSKLGQHGQINEFFGLFTRAWRV